eukprot:TRINITY_DN550_c1_g1_i4.p1 TRINITY_DN550_c1_g1~~TRINITY_DN550_c1_g1_i4.p1  ORF type:complete len:4792 (+),score=837.30 TRINITY_DN550_c1_g1_i4:378-14378(+)
MAKAMAATGCDEYNECLADLAHCPDCAGDNCTEAKQTCVDPSSTDKQDWYCKCALPSTDTQVGGAVDMCTIDECNTVCTHCADTGGGNMCENADQVCEEGDTSAAVTSDWQCRCKSPFQVIAADAGIATCVVDECSEPFGPAGILGKVCTDEGQECHDHSFSTVNDFECSCKAPKVGKKTAEKAYCTLDECLIAAHNETCTNAGQRCDDPDINIVNTWRCVCLPPSVTTAALAAADCLIDECVVEEKLAKCRDATPQQTCEDKDQKTDGTYVCKCVAPALGQATAATATCVLDECTATCATCAGATCTDHNQDCNDPSKTIADTEDWTCTCKHPGLGSATKAHAVCTYDECDLYSDTCTNASPSQTCHDAAPDKDNLHDWRCLCTDPYHGEQVASAAVCTLDECTASCGTCAGTTCGDAMQNCEDLDKKWDGTNNWKCVCRSPAKGELQTGAVVTCIVNECLYSANDNICKAGGQFCIDYDNATLNDWKCKCNLPAKQEVVMALANCSYDECEDQGHVCEGATPTQNCVDPDHAVAPLGNWECHCIAPEVGTARAAVVDCIVDECELVPGRCGSEQDCFDEDNTTRGDWYCKCRYPQVGQKTAAQVDPCGLDECHQDSDGNDPLGCKAADQVCNEPNMDIANDAKCVCKAPSRDEKVGGPLAQCSVDECEAQASVCMSRGQQCTDPDKYMDGDWKCACVFPEELVGTEKVNQPQTCEDHGEDCRLNAYICHDAGQTCDAGSPSDDGHYACHCTPPSIGPDGVDEPATCVLDECTITCDTCAQSDTHANPCTGADPPQDCHDPDTLPSALSNWQCKCKDPYSGIMDLAAVEHCEINECEKECSHCADADGNGNVCVNAGQSCREPSLSDFGDWECLCIHPQVSPTNMSTVAAATTCTLDECVVHGSVCTDAGQTCKDDNQDVTATGDWKCFCPFPSYTVSEAMAATVCVVDECHMTDLGHYATCDAAGQDCVDADQDNRGNWECRCRSPSSGKETERPVASCSLDECHVECEHCDLRAGSGSICAGGVDTVLNAQHCEDPNPTAASTNDWMCVCDNGARRAVGAATQCGFDECRGIHSGSAVLSCTHLRRYTKDGCLCECGWTSDTLSGVCHDGCCNVDGSVPSLKYGECKIADDVYNTAKGGLCPVAEFQSCRMWADTPTDGGSPIPRPHLDHIPDDMNNICVDEGQLCVDPDPALLEDWKCVCVAPNRTSDAVAQIAICVLDECDLYKTVCTNEGQTCNDPVMTPTSLRDWGCSCVGPATGSAVAKAAACETEECDHPKSPTCATCAGDTCSKSGQDCEDRTSEALGDWYCLCKAPSVGEAHGSPALCTLNECMKDPTCTARAEACNDCEGASPAQTCTDPTDSPNSIGDWICTCALPSVSNATAGVAVCRYDECSTNPCPAGQTCAEPDQKVYGDWRCECNAPYYGAGEQKVASCLRDECDAHEAECTHHGQECVDEDRAKEDSWVCKCLHPDVGNQGNQQPAVCTSTLECVENGHVCSEAGQHCEDPSEDLDNWVCKCIAPEVETTPGTQGVAQCKRDECELVCATCQRKTDADVKTCEGHDQKCDDPNMYNHSDWVCLCVAPAEGARPTGSTKMSVCSIDECEKTCPSCEADVCSGISPAQTCHDPDTSVDMLDDWYCKCPEPSPNVATKKVVADCAYNECTDPSKGGVCTDADQNCIDTDLHKGNDWECHCKLPGSGSKKVNKADGCGEYDECLADTAHCDTCAGTTCSDKNQTCDDPSPTIYSDWRCLCPLPYSGFAVGAAVADMDCALDECVAQCGSCADTGGGNVCNRDGQTCEEGLTNMLGVSDWKCRCSTPFEFLTGAAKPAECYLNECTDRWSDGTIKGFAKCDPANQDCADPSLNIVDDFTCSCRYPQVGTKINAVANCTLDECLVPEINATCADKGQTCFDPNTSEDGNWICVCAAPSASTAVGAFALCLVDECGLEDVKDVCPAAKPPQLCEDPEHSVDSMGDWKCNCIAPAEGTGAQAPADCILDECEAACITCEQNKCFDAMQDCEDRGLGHDSLNDWYCICQSPATGEAQASVVACALDECDIHAPTCAAATPSQSCRDQVKTEASKNDWLCECNAPNQGSEETSAAFCVRDECIEHSVTCTAEGQTCHDTDKAVNKLGDWECRCIPPAEEKATAEPAPTCTYLGDCRFTEIESVCTARGQACKDDDETENNVWRCECVAPAKGPSGAQAAADCELDECTESCATCEGTTCADAGQDCADVDKDSWSGLSNWVCRCRTPKIGSATKGVASCTLDECIDNAGTCTAAQQTCFDNDVAVTANWICQCPAPAEQTALGMPATCSFDECTTNSKTCTDAGQMCEDSDQSIGDGLDTWVCICPLPTSGRQVGGAATCSHDECTLYNSTCGAQQICVDKDPLEDNTWYCQCDFDSTQEEQGKAVECMLDECEADCESCEKDTCSNAGQTCDDEDPVATSLRNWMCSCPPVTTSEPALGAVADCVNNECAWSGASSQCEDKTPPQRCVDDDWKTDGDWVCECLPPYTGSAIESKLFLLKCKIDECSRTENAEACTLHSQECKDEDKETEGTWACHCPFLPNSNVGGPADCTPPPEDECSNDLNRQTCEGAHHQACHDPDQTKDDDWQCECVSPATGTIGYQSAGQCALDECTADCAHCAGTKCSDHDQTCEDPDDHPDVINDWSCKCKAPSRGEQVTGYAVCTLNECIEQCSTCADKGSGNTCTEAAQKCVDHLMDPHNVHDWLCTCRDPQIGEMTAGPATCTLNECDQHGHVCPDGQECEDPNTSPQFTDDWSCKCLLPAVGDARMAPATCELNECADTMTRETCTNEAQSCVDPNMTTESTGDWECHCPVGGSTAKAMAATCVLDECTTTCSTCAQTKANGDNMCEAAGQTCDDPTRDPSMTRDWSCICPGGIPKAAGNVAVCTIDECRQLGDQSAHTCDDTPRYTTAGCHCKCGWKDESLGVGPGGNAPCNSGCCNPDGRDGGKWCEIDHSSSPDSCKDTVSDTCIDYTTSDTVINKCKTAGQHCIDPDTSAAKQGDWQCSCISPATGAATMAALATCTTDECITNGHICTAETQTCHDPTDMMGDWVCKCPKGAMGSSVTMGPAACEWVGECVTYGHICEQVSQACEDEDKVNDGNWVCSCVSPATGASVQGAVAVCVLNECVADCPTCARTTCTAAGQACRDLSESATDLGDWLCECTGDGTGHQQGAAADCSVDECRSNGGTNGRLCSNAGQSCFDPDKHALGNWKCVCNSPSSGHSTAKLATCNLDECIVQENADTCTAAGQLCADNNPSAENDWQCNCAETDEFGVTETATCTGHGWCAANGDVCTAAGQACVNGKCRCIPPQTGDEKDGEPTDCVLDECNAVCATCANQGDGNRCEDAGQTCNEGSTLPGAKGDWQCTCSDGKISATAAVADCIVNECNEHGITCTVSEQQCIDPDTSADSLKDWRCECYEPLIGRATQAAAVCTFDECTLREGVCEAVGQICFDPDVMANALDDWQCECISPSTGDPVRGGVATCEQKGECGANAETCLQRGQVCADPDMSTDGDWECRCTAPRTGVAGKQQPAECRLDECASVCSHCAQLPGSSTHVCRGVGQECVDPNKADWSSGDWLCKCTEGQGQRMGAVAKCAVDECAAPENSRVCTMAEQECVDPDLSQPLDWRCRCYVPTTGPDGLNAPAPSCTLNECSANYQCAQCGDHFKNTENGDKVCGDGNQRCVDPSLSKTGDWRCECPYSLEQTAKAVVSPCQATGLCASNAGACESRGQYCMEEGDNWYCKCVPPYTGRGMGIAAMCELNECEAACKTCEGGVCSMNDQVCQDPDVTALDNWMCLCKEGIGGARGAVATCELDECFSNSDVCEAAGQVCRDPDMTVTSTGDWLCICVHPEEGHGEGAAASCKLDECATHGSVCTAKAQRCIDEDTSPDSSGDWACMCEPPALGSAAMGTLATCTYFGACDTEANRAVCESVGQKCIPGEDESDGTDFRCACLSPAVGTPVAQAATVCTLNECHAVCPTCAHTSPSSIVDVCELVGQTCVDPDDKVSTDWVCECPPPSVEYGLAKPADNCKVDECKLAPIPPCESEGQTCNDPTSGTRGDWRCECSDGQWVVGGLASCGMDECIGNDVCSEAGQKCRDPMTSPSSTGDWECVCLSGEGSALRAAAKCSFGEGDECADNAAVCKAASQFCLDPNFDKLDDWECRCIAPSTGPPGPKSVADCGINECVAACDTCAKQTSSATNVCLLNGQTCTDPSMMATGDWFCSCRNGQDTKAIGEPADCSMDECEVPDNAKVCSDATPAQTCTDLYPSTPNDWRCNCIAPATGFGVSEAAECGLNECMENGNHRVCAAVGQHCYDPSGNDGDWLCICPTPASGRAEAKVAECTWPQGHECGTVDNLMLCVAGDQFCVDPSVTSDGDWYCACYVATAKVVPQALGVCGADECKNNTICSANEPSQLCVDPNMAVANDWVCRCLSPQVGDDMPLAVAKCEGAACSTFEEEWQCVNEEGGCKWEGGVCKPKAHGAGDNGDGDDEGCWWCWLLIVLALCCCCCWILLFLLYTRRKKEQQCTDHTEWVGAYDGAQDEKAEREEFNKSWAGMSESGVTNVSLLHDYEAEMKDLGEGTEGGFADKSVVSMADSSVAPKKRKKRGTSTNGKKKAETPPPEDDLEKTFDAL